MADDEDLLVQVEGEEQAEHEGEGSERENPVDQLNRQLEALKADNKKQQENAARANQAAAQERARAEAATREATEARAVIADTELDAIVSRIAGAQAKAEAAQRDYEAAEETGDAKKKADAARRLARAESEAFQYEASKADLELRRSASGSNERNNEQNRPSPQRTVDPFEDHLRNFTPRTADWMREHRDWVVDPRKNAKLMGAHHMAVGDGLTADTDEYFAHVEKTLGLGTEEPPARQNGAGNGQVRTTPARRTTPVVAPVSGGGGAHSSGAGESRGAPTVTLSPGEARMAKETLVWNKGERDAKGVVIKEDDPRLGQPIGVQEYARRKLQLQKGGYYDKSYTHG